MNKLRQYIRAVLLEAAYRVEDLEGLKAGEYNDQVFFLVDPGGNDRFQTLRLGTEDAYEDDVDGEWIARIDLVKRRDCGGAWMVGMVEANDGWGPLMYDIAMEWATQNGGGLVADRTQVSLESRRVWEYYLNKRNDPTIAMHQLDNPRDPQTKDKKDDCDMSAASWNDYAVDVTKYETDWKSSPLSKRWTKEPVTLNKISSMRLRL